MRLSHNSTEVEHSCPIPKTGVQRVPKAATLIVIRFNPLPIHVTANNYRFKMYPGMKKKALERRDVVAKRKFKMTHAQRQERFQQLKNERLQREREEYDSLTPEQKRRRDLRDEKRAKKASSNRKLKVRTGRFHDSLTGCTRLTLQSHATQDDSPDLFHFTVGRLRYGDAGMCSYTLSVEFT